MSAVEFSRMEQHLLTHASAMGGWLTASYIRDNREPAARVLLQAGLLEWAEQGRIIRLTEAGASVAAGMKWVDA